MALSCALSSAVGSATENVDFVDHDLVESDADSI